MADDRPYWSLDIQALLASLRTSREGLGADEAARRRAARGVGARARSHAADFVTALVGQFKNPLSWLLLFAVAVSSIAREWVDAAVVGGILAASAVLSATQEHRATRAVDALRSRVALRAQVLRDGAAVSVVAGDVVPGDVVLLSAGTLLPADAVVIDARDLTVSQSILTGETFPVDKAPGPSPADAALAGRSNVLYQGTSVRSGVARAVVVTVGGDTEYGRIAATLALRAPETDFERGVRRFGHLLTRIMLVLVMFTFASTVLAHKPAVDSLLFAISLAVGIAPEMLPAVIAINLSHGARRMAERGVIVRRLAAIENFGAMDVLCTDKTGTLTEGVVALERSVDPDGADAPAVLALAAANAWHQAGLKNPLDDAIVARAEAAGLRAEAWVRLDEVPYDFVRKRLTVALRSDTGVTLVTKGAFAKVLDVCVAARRGGEVISLDEGLRASLHERAAAYGRQGVRTLAVASRVVAMRAGYGRDDEREMVFEGTLCFLDKPKADAAEALRALAALGVGVKVITGDSREVAVHLAETLGLDVDVVMTGAELLRTRDEALWHLAAKATVFAEVDPNQKERIILALRKTGHVVGYMGDGINDAPALHAADVAVSVDGAADVAREAADFVLLRRDLGVLRDGIVLGRSTFANTLKYVFTTESANVGNMLSMAAAAAFLPFLPLLASQVLLNNFLSDIPAMAIGTDAVDPDQLERPLRWNLRELRDFMLSFGALSSAFDLLTFGGLLWVARASAPVFRTGWFLESLLTEVAVALIVRTRRPFYASRPSRLLLGASVAVAVTTVLLVYTPPGRLFGLVALPPRTLALLVVVTAAYVSAVEALKRSFFRRFGAKRA